MPDAAVPFGLNKEWREEDEKEAESNKKSSEAEKETNT
jgi:hypothetical protein